MNVALMSDAKSLPEVVATAIGIVRDKASLGYFADVVTSKDLTNGKQTNLINGLTGKSPGLQIGRSSGGVNTATRITMRGQRSLTGEGSTYFHCRWYSLSATLDYRTGNVIYSGTKSILTFTGSTKQTTEYGRQPFIYPNSVIETSPGIFVENTTVKTKSSSYDFWHTNYISFAESIFQYFFIESNS